MRGLVTSGLVAALGAGCGSPAEGGGELPTPAATVATTVDPEQLRPQWASWGGVPWPTGEEGLQSKLRRAELDRDAEAPAIERAWQHAEPTWQAAGAWSLARIGGATARERFSALFDDGRTELSAPTMAAVSLLSAPGADEVREPSWDSLEERLWTRYAVTEEPDQADALLLAIARVGSARSPGWLAADLAVVPGAGDQGRYVHAMEALAILCTRGHALPVDGLQAVARGLGSPDLSPRRAAAYTLARCAAVSAERLAGAERGELVELLVPMLAGDDAQGARRAWRALEGLGELPRVVPGWVLGAKAGDWPGDWMAEVAAVRALAAHADGRKVLARRLPAIELTSFTGARLHVLRELLVQLRPFAAHEAALERPLEMLRSSLRAAVKAAATTSDARRAKALTLIGCELEVLLATRSGQLEPLVDCAKQEPTIPTEHAQTLAIEALVHMGPVVPREQRLAALVERAKDPRPRVAAPALGALAGVDDPAVGPALREGLARADMGVVAAAAGAVAARAADQERRDPEAVSVLLSVIDRFDNDHAVEARIAAIDALGRLARSMRAPDGPGGAQNERSGQVPGQMSNWIDRLVALSRDPAFAVRAAARRALRDHPQALEAFEAGLSSGPRGEFAASVHQAVDLPGAPGVGLRLETDAGVITIDFSGAPAPIAQANLLALAEQGFFDGVVFHRVVPGFVIQGGDPRGDGYGGPGHVMPCEWSNLRYARGTVGIALAGKDTGGSQLFIAHDQPRHLDARYTVIGRVVDGMDVVDKIWPYDRILRVDRLDQLPDLPPGSDERSTP
ncbi:MAG: peptidylprolyl isomerase [Myxococcota bacterium]